MKNLDLAVAFFFIIIITIGVVIECSCEKAKKEVKAGWKCNKTHCVKIEKKNTEDWYEHVGTNPKD